MALGNQARQHTTLESKVYVVRVIFSIATLAMLALNDSLCRGLPGDHLWILVVGLLYPHIGQLLLGRLDISRRRGHLLFMLDGLFAGTVIGALDFALLPSAVLLLTSLFNWMVVGGGSLLAFGVTFLFAGTLVSGTTLPFTPSALFDSACTPTNWLAGILLVGHFIIVARIIHRLVGELRMRQATLQTQTDNAIVAKTTAEQALLATLPPCSAERLMQNGRLDDETLPEATLLYLEFNPSAGFALTHDDLKDAFRIGESILLRHGIELIKTWGHRAIALGRDAKSPDHAVASLREIDAFLADHQGMQATGQIQLNCRGAIHCGTVTLGLVQPKRMNLDFAGESVDQLLVLARQLHEQPATCILSAAAYQRLANPESCNPLGGTHGQATAYQCLPRPAP